MTDAARAAGVDVSHVSVDPAESSGVGHILLEVTEHGAQNRITVCPGANYTMKVEDIAWLREEIARDADDAVRVCHGGHRDGGGMGLGRRGARYSKSAPAAPISPKLLSCATYLSPNEHEAALIAGHPIRTDAQGVCREDVAAVAAAFRKEGWSTSSSPWERTALWRRGRRVSMKRPACGCPMWRTPRRRGTPLWRPSAPACARGCPRRLLALASHTAAITVTRMGAIPSLPTAAEVQALLRAGLAALTPPSWTPCNKKKGVNAMKPESRQAVAHFLIAAGRELNAFLEGLEADGYEAAVQMIRESRRGGGRVHVTGIGSRAMWPAIWPPCCPPPGPPPTSSTGQRPLHGSCGQLVADVVICISTLGRPPS